MNKYENMMVNVMIKMHFSLPIIERDQKAGKVSLTQKEYMKKVFQKFNINGKRKSVSTLFAPHFKLKANMSPTSVEECEYMTYVSYTSVVGSLMYTIVCVQGLICHKLSQWLADTCMILVGIIRTVK